MTAGHGMMRHGCTSGHCTESVGLLTLQQEPDRRASKAKVHGSRVETKHLNGISSSKPKQPCQTPRTKKETTNAQHKTSPNEKAQNGDNLYA